MGGPQSWGGPQLWGALNYGDLQIWGALNYGRAPNHGGPKIYLNFFRFLKVLQLFECHIYSRNSRNFVRSLTGNKHYKFGYALYHLIYIQTAYLLIIYSSIISCISNTFYGERNYTYFALYSERNNKYFALYSERNNKYFVL